uniref:Uncharacterized protein n=1 Tax=viral metagenome TaxID=1070528 RepID=A0A6M3IJQ9_9ZZZZ
MTVFDDLCTQALAPALLAAHGETVTYFCSTGNGAIDAGEFIQAIVYREPKQQRGPSEIQRVEYPIEIDISQSDKAVIVPNGDTVALRKRVGDSSNTTFRVAEILNSDGGMWRLGLN